MSCRGRFLRKCKQVLASHSYFHSKAILKISRVDVSKGSEAGCSSGFFSLNTSFFRVLLGGGVPPAATKRICHWECETIYAGVLGNKKGRVTV